MTLYPLALLAHSYLRWVVLVLAALALFRSARGWRRGSAFTPGDARLAAIFLGVFDTQVLLGLLLWLVLSPISAAAFQEPRKAMWNTGLRFFGIEHLSGMIVAILVLHVGHRRAKKRPEGTRHRTYALTLGGTLFWLIVSIPWPGLPYARPLLRSLPALGGAPGAPDLFTRRCAPCHGPAGQGDGLAASSLNPRPRDYRDVVWQTKVTDEQLKAVIRDGGAAHGLAIDMPSHASLSEAEIDELVRFIRRVGGR